MQCGKRSTGFDCYDRAVYSEDRKQAAEVLAGKAQGRPRKETQ